jgi:alkylhydroperoxidase family enzyme
MPRIPPLDAASAPAAIRETFDRFMRERGNIPNMFRTLALRPEMMRATEALLTAVMTTGTLSRLLKELVSVRVSALNGCDY